MAKKRPFYKKFRWSLYETVTDKGNSVLRYRGHDDKEHYVASSEAPDIEPGGGGITEVTWQELKGKRDNGELNPGSLYRITDYQCTTTQENTQSAGHQFDIVLLALSENKLAEEGWAMMNESNIYDVTFSNGVTRKCWIYQDDYVDNIVDCITLMGSGGFAIGEDSDNDIVLNKSNNTAICKTTYTSFHEENLTYNYFQNSNLSAWKVWYCLDNDKSRFAWAKERQITFYLPPGRPGQSEQGPYVRTYKDDDIENNEYGWGVVNSSTVQTIFYSYGLDITTNYTLHMSKGAPQPPQGQGPVPSRVIIEEGTGVIYRLIDEWGNDCPYDFKNIVIYLGGKIEKGYLFSSNDGDIFGDMSLTGVFDDITVKKTIDDNNCQVIDMGILVTDVTERVTERCNIIVAGGALSEDGVNTLSSNVIFGYTMV